MIAKTNIIPFSPSRTPPAVGDVFALRLRDQTHLFGRVIRMDALATWGMPGSILIYIYSIRTTDDTPPDRRQLIPENLLIPPLMINRLPWTKGYLKTVAHWPLEPHEVLRQHCFSAMGGRQYYDEYGNELRSPTQPCGTWGLASYRVLDDEVSEASGLPRVPD